MANDDNNDNHNMGDNSMNNNDDLGFLTQQPTLVGCIPGRVGVDFYNDDDNYEDNNDGNDHN